MTQTTRLLPEFEPNSFGECRICRASVGKTQRSYDRPIFESKDYFALASIGALVPGWLLIFPREHTPNLLERYSDPQFIRLRSKICGELQARFDSDVRMFEHGPVTQNSCVGCGVDHAHLHLVPIPFSLENLATDAGDPDIFWRRGLSTEAITLSSGREYLLCSDSPEENDPTALIALPQAPRSQYFRRLIASELGLAAEFDYRAHPQLANVSRTESALHKIARA